jgi:hypothetical protein
MIMAAWINPKKKKSMLIIIITSMFEYYCCYKIYYGQVQFNLKSQSQIRK